MQKIILVLFLSLSASVAWGQEVYLLGGKIENTATHDDSLNWGVGYIEGLGEHVAVGLTYLNEGHISDHLRDGFTPQLWLRTNVMNRQLSLAVGMGPYYYFDTVLTNRSDSFDAHGWGAISSMTVTLYTESRFLFQIRGNWINTASGFNSASVMGGIGYQLDAPATEGPLDVAPQESKSTTRNEITVLGGDTVFNQFHSEYTFSDAIEYRRSILPYLDVTVGLLSEDYRNDSRYGATGQLWLVRSCFDDRLVLGVGVGPYFGYDRDGSTALNGIIGLTAAYSFGDRWVGRVIWDRVLTSNSRDADVFLGGLGYRF